MKRNTLILVVGVILLVIFFLLLFTFQVRQTEVAVVTTFDKPSADPITEPGLYFKWPVPIQKVYKFDKRIHSFEDAYEQVLTADGLNILANVYVGWTISEPLKFFSSFPAGEAEAAEPVLKSVVRTTKQAVIGRHSFSDFVSSDPQELQFAEVENELLQSIRDRVGEKYGVEIEFVGIKRLGLPQSVTQKVFDRMTAERQAQVDRIQSEGERAAMEIRATAEREREEILAKARAQAKEIRGTAEAQASQFYEVFKQNPELAVFLMKLEALQSALKQGSTLIVDGRTPPFNLLVPENGAAPAEPEETQAPRPRGGAGEQRPTLSQNLENQ